MSGHSTKLQNTLRKQRKVTSRSHCGGNHDDTNGYFIEPTVLTVNDPSYRTMCEEIFGPVLSVYVYEPADLIQSLKLLILHRPMPLLDQYLPRTDMSLNKLLKSFKMRLVTFISMINQQEPLLDNNLLGVQEHPAQMIKRDQL